MQPDQNTTIKRLRLHSPLDKGDLEALAALPLRVRVLEPRENLVVAGDQPDFSAVLVSGVVARYLELEHGHRRYLSFHFPGEWPVPFPPAGALDFAVCSFGAAQVALVNNANLFAVCEDRPRVAFALWRESLFDAAIARQAIANAGGRSKRASLAHLLCELYARARSAGMAKSGKCLLPLTQEVLAAALGMSLVTLNRTMQALRQTGAVDFRNGLLSVGNFSKLAVIGDFDPYYLGALSLAGL